MQKVFSSKQKWEIAIVQALLADLDKAIRSDQMANVLLSGGSTPGPVYELLDQNCNFIEKVQFGLVDERFVPISSEFSNESLIRSCFKTHSQKHYNIEGMVFDSTDEEANLEILKEKYEGFTNRTHLSILGMGADGHTASIFPGDIASERAINQDVSSFLATRAPSEPRKRITCNMKLITESNEIYLLISGEEKWRVLNDTARKLPIHYLLSLRPDTKIYYLNESK